MKHYFFLIFLFVALSKNAFSNIRYVTPSGAGALDGSSWANAYAGASLQVAIDLSVAGDEVWVASGTYFTTASADRTIAFSMRNGVSIYGSFSGTETLVSQRVLTNGLTSILSGEIGALGIVDNSYHTISNSALDTTAIIDGFVIQDANDDRQASLNEGLGGGIYNDGSNPGSFCSPTIRNCVITSNQAVFGAGIFNNGYNGGNASPRIYNCVIANNIATTGGGGMDNFGLLNGNASPTISNCVFYNNSAAQRAGAMYCWGGNNGNTNPTVINTTFVNNSAIDGGAIVSDQTNSFGGNSGNSNPNFRNCIFSGNTASGIGPQFFILGVATFVATYTNIDTTAQVTPHVISGAGTGNISTSPLFTNSLLGAGTDGNWITADDGLQLQSNSPCIDAGDTNAVATIDILSQNRIFNLSTDMGAYEFNSTTTSMLEKNELNNAVFVYPNPTSNAVNILFTMFETENVIVYLSDINGRLINTIEKGIIEKGNHNYQIDISELENGIYLLNINSDKGKQIRKFVKK